MSKDESIDDLIAFYRERGYRNRVGFGSRPAILVIDFSVAFTRGTPDFPTGSYDDEIAATARLLEQARGRFPVHFTTIAYDEDMADAGLWAVKIPWLSALKSGTPGVDIDERVSPRPGEEVIVKKYASSFHGTKLDEILRRDGVDTLVIAGCTTSCCVRATAVDAIQSGYRTIIAADCVGDLNPALHRLNLVDLDSRYADVLTSGQIEQAFAALPQAQ